jgi:Rrf2 family protein
LRLQERENQLVGGLLGVSEAASLALHALAIIAGRAGTPVSTEDIARLLEASEAHLSKVLQRLSKADLVSGKPGPGGGFTLEKSPGEVTLLEIYEAMEGPLETKRCLFDLPVCDRGTCPLSLLLSRHGREIADELSATTLEEFRVPAKAAGRR